MCPVYLPSGIRDELGALQFNNKASDDIDALDWEQRSLDDIGRIAPARAFSTPDAPVYEAPGQIQLSGPRRPVQPEQSPDWRPLNAQIAEQARQMNQQATGGQAATGADPTTMSDRSPATAAPVAASGVPQAMPSGDVSDEAWARQEAARLGIDPQKAVDVGNTEGGFTQPGIQNRQGAPAYGPYQHYIGGPGKPGLGDEALAAGIDPRDPANSKRLITHALEHAARNGWGAFQGAAANGIGNWDGIGGRPESSPTAAAAPSAAGTLSAPAADSSRSAAGGWEVDQAALDDPDKWSLCGPVAAVMAATKRGGQWTVAQAKKIATESGLWNVNQGMGGLQTEVSLLQKLGVAAQTGAADLQHLTSDALAGNTPIISTVKHYFILKGYDPETGRFDTTTSGSVLKGGSRWLTLDQIEKLGGGIQGAAYIDNPSSPISSAVAGSSDAYKLSDTQTADDMGGLSPGEQKRQKMAASGLAVDQPGPLQGQRTQSYWNPETQNVEPAPGPLPQVVERMPQSNVRTAPDGTPLGGNGSAADEMRGQQVGDAPRPGTDQPIQNPDGSVTTERSITVTEPGLNGGRATNIPTVWDGKVVSDQEAVDNAIRSGGAFPSFGSVDEAVRAAEQRSRDLGAGQATSVGGASVPPEVQNALPNRNRPVRGGPIDESDGLQYRQPLQATSGPDSTTGADPSSTYNDPTEGGTLGQPLPAQSDTNGQNLTQSDTFSPSLDPGGAQFAAQDAYSTPVQPQRYDPYSGSSDPVANATRSVQPDTSPTSPTSPPGFPGLQAVYDAGGNFLHWIQGAATDVGNTVATEGIATPIGRGIANAATRPLLGKPPLADSGQPETSIDRAIVETGRSLGSNISAAQQGYQSGDPLQAGLGVLGVVGDLAPTMILSRQLNEMLPKADTPLGEIGVGDVVMTAALAHDAARLGYGAIRAGGRTLESITRAIREGVPAEQFGEWLANGVTGSGMAADRVAAEVAPAVSRVIDEAPSAAPQSFRDFSNTLKTPANEGGQLAVSPTAPRPTNDQLIREQYGRPWEEVPRDPATQAMRDESMSRRPVPNEVSATDAANLRTVQPYPNMEGRMNAGFGVSASAGLIGDVANSLGSGVAGAGVGAGLPADTPEERRRNALIGAGVGMGAGPAIGRILPREGGALATFGASPNYRPPTPAQIKAAEVQGARRGEMLNREVKPPGSSVPLGARLSTALTDPLAATRYAENLLTDTAGVPRLPDNSPLRASTLLRENPTGFIKDRIETELAAPVIEAAQKGLQTELPRYVEDTHQRDILDKFYGQAWQGVIDDRAQKIADAQARGVNPNVIARMQAKMQADAVQAGETAMRRRQGSNAEHTYEATNARLLEQEQRLTASGTFGDLQSLAQQIVDSARTTLDNSVAAGRVEPQVAADLKAMYLHYVPTVPISKLDPGGRSFGASSGGTTVGASKTNPIHALEDVGSSSERLNPIVAVRNQIVTQERQNHQNQVFQAFAQLMDNAGVPTPGTMGKKPNLWEGERQISGRINGQPETRMVPASVANGIESMTQAGMGPDAAVNVYKRVVGWFAGQLTAARASYIPLNLARDAGDTFFNTMVKNGGPARLPQVMGTWLDEASRAVADVAAAQATPRGIVGAAGGFAYGATQVDDQNAPISTRLLHGAEAAIPGAFLLGANKNVNVSSRAANEFIARGGASGGISSGWRTGQRWYRDVLRDGGTPIKSAQDMALFMRDWAGDVWNLQGLKGANERLDLVGRTTAMRVAEARGAGATEAMIAGRDSSYDPDKAGTILRAVNGMIPFTNATVQGGAQFARALRDHPGTTLATVAATLAPVMLGVEAWNRSDPQRAQIYDNVPQYLKDSGIIWVPPVEWGQGSDTRGSLPRYLWIPTEITTPFVVGMRGAMQHLDTVVPGIQPSAGRSDVNPDAPEWQKWLGVLNEAVQIFNPTHGDTAAAIASGAVPPVIKQTMELGLNKDLYRGNAIMSDPADERASALSQGISRTANDLGSTLNSTFLQDVRPSGVEHILRADPAHYDIASGISDQVKSSPYKAAEQGRIANEPFVGGIASRFVRDTGGANLERAQGQTLNQQVQAILQSARMRPSEADLTVPADYKGANLTRDEMVRWQQQANIEIQSGITDALDSKQWDDPMTRSQAVKDAISKAKERAAKDALGLTPRDIKDRIEQQSILQRQAVGAR